MSKKRTVREVQHKLAAILMEVQQGEVVLITKRGRVIAKIVRIENDAGEPAPVPDFAARRQALFPDGPPPGPLASDLISTMRGQR